jgi:hypothetical protein
MAVETASSCVRSRIAVREKSNRFRRTKHGWPPSYFVIPAKAGTQAAPKSAASLSVGM